MAKTQSGLSYFDEGSTVEVPVTAAKSKTGLTPAGKINLDETETTNILSQMQKLIDERKGPMNTFLGGLQRASAWGSGGAQGPSAALTAMDRERMLQDQETLGIQEKMAAYRASQAQARSDSEKLAGFQGGAGAGGMPNISQEAQARVNLARTPSEKLAIINEDLKTQGGERAKAQFNPSSMDRKEALVMNPQTGKPELREVNAFEYRDLEAKGLIVPASQMYGVGVKPPAPGAPTGGVTIPTSAIRQVESRGDASAVSPKGAEGTMQVMPATQTTPGFGVTPAANKTPQELERVGDDYFNAMKQKYKDDITAAIAYNMGPGATDKWIAAGKQFSQLPAETQQYIKKLTSQPGAVSAAPTGMPDIAAIKAERKLTETESTAAATERGKSGEAMRTSFEADTDPTTVSESLITSKRVQDLVKDNPTIAGVLAAPGLPSALATVLKGGIGSFGIKEIEDAIYLSQPATTRQSLGERNELITYLARVELQAAKMIKGQGQITEGEREILARASSSVRDPAESIYKKAKMLEAIARKNDELAKIYGSGDEYKNFRQFKTDPRVKALDVKYRDELKTILNEKVDFSKQRADAGLKQVQHPSDIQAIINKGKKETP
jgi:hypothetical protein